MRAIALLCCLAAPAQAAEPLSAEEFRQATEGQTLFYRYDNGDYGIEEYQPGRRVRWSFLDGDCLEGVWYPAGELICFAYEGIETHQCWSFFLDGGRLMAVFENDPGSTLIFETRRSAAPIECRGPKVGV